MTYLLGCFFLAAGVFFLLRDTWHGLVFGAVIIGNGVNLTIFSIGDVRQQAFPFIGNSEPFVDPINQALVLTAIVISFATLCFLAAVVKKLNQVNTDE